MLHDGVGRGTAERRAAALFDQVGLPASRVRDRPHQLSGGQRQRAMIAMALACSPRLIVADEPASALDVIARSQILRLLVGLVRARGIGLLLISHDLSLLAGSCDRLAVMYAGRVVEQGPAARVIDGPRHPYTRALVDVDTGDRGPGVAPPAPGPGR